MKEIVKIINKHIRPFKSQKRIYTNTIIVASSFFPFYGSQLKKKWKTTNTEQLKNKSST